MVLTFNKIDLLIVNNCLNEVLHGFKINDFSSVIGCSEKVADDLLDKIGKIYESTKEKHEDVYELELDKMELQIINNSIKQVLNYLGQEDCHTRIGATEDEIIKLIQKIS